jgi:hypothetical protein
MLVSLHGALYPCFINRLAHSGGIYMWEVIVLFADIGVIVDNHYLNYLNFLFLTVTQSRIVPDEKQDEQ